MGYNTIICKALDVTIYIRTLQTQVCYLPQSYTIFIIGAFGRRRRTHVKMKQGGQVITRFVGLKEINGRLPSFWTKVVEDEDAEEVDRMLEGFVRDEPMSKHVSKSVCTSSYLLQQRLVHQVFSMTTNQWWSSNSSGKIAWPGTNWA